MADPLLKYKIGISLIPKIGPVLAKRLIAYTGSLEAVFSEKKKNLLKIPGFGEKIIDQVLDNGVLSLAEKEIEYIEKNNIIPLFYLDEDYPRRLKQCEDAPVILYAKGNVNLNETKTLSIVGTRNASDYGRELCNQMVSGLAENHKDILIISGLAYGIDICAHKAALKHDFFTVAVLGHGLSWIYPSVHKAVARQITEKGALVSEFLNEETPEAPNFVKRNRIIAGLADVTVVIESGEKGGALITAEIANSYNRDVMAFPGRVSDKYSSGCNKLIKNNKASLAESVADLEYLMGWEPKKDSQPTQKKLFIELSVEEQKVMDSFGEKNEQTIDEIAMNCHMPGSKISYLLINLEFNGLIRCCPGKLYRKIR
jgi:DNA processing protein